MNAAELQKEGEYMSVSNLASVPDTYGHMTD